MAENNKGLSQGSSMHITRRIKVKREGDIVCIMTSGFPSLEQSLKISELLEKIKEKLFIEKLNNVELLRIKKIIDKECKQRNIKNLEDK